MENEQEVAVEEIEDIEEVEDSDDTDWKARAKELERKAILQRAKTKELKLKLSEFQAKPPEKKEVEIENTKTDYAKLAFLAAEGIPQEDRQYVLAEAKATGKDLSERKARLG